METIWIVLLMVIPAWILKEGLIVVRNQESIVLEKLGKYFVTLESGIYWSLCLLSSLLLVFSASPYLFVIL